MSCYFPSGSPAPDDEPCNASAPVSHCCRKPSVCLSNGYCFNAGTVVPYVLSRGACTDSTFQSPSCPQRCKDVAPSGPLSVPAVLGFPNAPAQYCCDSYNSSGSCSYSSLGLSTPFELAQGDIIWNRTDGSATPPATLASASASSSSSSLPSILLAPTASSSIIYQRDKSHDVAIGAGVGVPLGTLLIALLVALLFQIRQRKRIEKSLEDERRLGSKSYEAGYNANKMPMQPELSGTPLAELPNPSTELYESSGSRTLNGRR